MDEVENLRGQIAALRARVTIVERVAWLGAEIATEKRRQHTLDFLAQERTALAKAYAEGGPMTEGLTDVQRVSIAADVHERFDRLIKAVERVRGAT